MKSNDSRLTLPFILIFTLFLASCGGSSTNTTAENRFTAVGDRIVIDSRTSLVWERSGDSSLQTASQAEQYCSELTLGGYTDWRMPDLRELMSIIDYSRSNPAIASDIFSVATIPTTIGYWSSTISAHDPSYKWYVDFDLGKVFPYHTGSLGVSVRCVRGTASIPSSNFVDNGNGTITDSGTHLMWEQHLNENDALAIREWSAAAQYCQDLVLGGHSDWRLPEVTELSSILDYGREMPTINTSIFKNTPPWSNKYWTATTTAADDLYVWAIDFDGGIIDYYPVSYYFLTRCVRSNQ